MTAGGVNKPNAGSYSSVLASRLCLPVTNQGVGGQTSTQIGVRQGAVLTTVTVAGSVIPGAGSVRVTFPQGFEPVNNQGPLAGLSGTIAGVHGTVNYSHAILLFTRSQPGPATVVQGPTSFLVDKPYASYLPIFWEGREDYGLTSPLLNDLAAQVASVPYRHAYYVLSIVNSDVPVERKGGRAYNRIVSLNNQLANIYGPHYIDVRKALVDAYDPTSAADVWDYQADVIPTSLRAIKATGTLQGAISATDTTFNINLASGAVAASEILTIDAGASAENVMITSVSGSTVTVTRDAGGVIGPHAAGVAITATDVMHLNTVGHTVVANAIAPYLSEFSLTSGCRLANPLPKTRNDPIRSK